MNQLGLQKYFFNKNKAVVSVQALQAQIDAINRVLGVIEFQPDGIITKINANFLKVVGYAENEVVGKHHRMFAEPAFAESVEYQQFWQKLARGEFDQGQYKRVGNHGKEIWLEASYNPIFDESGKVYKVVKYATDITARKIKDTDTSEQLAAINKSQGTIELGLDGRVITANDNFLSILGYSLSEAVGQHHSAFVKSELANSQEYRDFWAKLNRGEFVSGKFERVGKGGKQIWLEASYNPILDINGKPYKVVKFASDITEQVRLEQRSKVLALVADNSDNAVLITDVNGVALYTNPGFTKMSGYTNDEVLGKRPIDVLKGKHTDQDTINRIAEKMASKKPFYDQILYYTKTGETYWVGFTMNPVFDASGNVDKFVSIQTNINTTKIQQLEFNTRLDAISRSSGIIEFTPTGEILYANENFCKVVGYDLNEIKGKHHSMFVDSVYRNSVEYLAFWQKLGRGEYDSGEYGRIAKNGKELWLQASYNPIIDFEGRVVKVVKFASDITAQHNVAQALNVVVDESVKVIESAKAGDLTKRVPLEGKTGAIAALCDGVNALMDKMTEVILQVREAGETINTAAGEIATGNNDLSSRTEQQASSLEETASSMEELASTVKQNAENAKQANQLAAAASGVAVKGGQVVGNVVTTMSAINESARKIEDIISVIDGIAFQTNILALNAAVEAARAGEQGRGFAVVAGEVRNLAQRSASAAKEIKELISDSVSKVQDGTKQVEEAGSTMTEIVTSVQRVTDIMGEITAASSEQSSGIDQVNQAVASMDEATQQNAALVEEAAAAAESLVDQAVNLMDTVSSFKLHGARQPERRASHSPMRSSFKPATRAPAPKAAPARVSAKTGTDDEWEAF